MTCLIPIPVIMTIDVTAQLKTALEELEEKQKKVEVEVERTR